MNLGSISDQLPTYPNNIQGELRIILQTKDVFLVCYKHLEEYRRLVNEQNRLITKEFVQEQLQIGEDEITELKMELQDAESRLSVRLRHNELLADHLASLGFASLESGGSVRHLALCRSPGLRKSMLQQRGGGAVTAANEPRPPTHMIDNIALAIAEIHQEVRAKVKPLLDYYRDLFYLQLHFSLVLGQVCNYCMPLVTENIGLIDRIFFWSERPEFDLVRRAGDIGDRLKEIYTRAQTVLSVLAESVRFLQSKVELQKTLEQRFHERLDEQQKTKDKILREVHTTKQNMDMLEEENDRLVGSLVKVDPSFVDSRHFYELAEGGTLLGAKKTQNMKETAQNNAEDKQEMMSNASPSAARMDVPDDVEKDNRARVNLRRNNDVSSPSSMDNPSGEMNNNKALSVLSDAPCKTLEPKAKGRKKASKEEMDELLQDIKAKMGTNPKKSPGDASKPVNINNVSEASGITSVTTDASVSGNESQMCFDRTTVQKPSKRAASRARSKSRKRDTSPERSRQSPPHEQRSKPVRRATSVDKERKQTKLKKHRPKSTMGGERRRNSDEIPKREHRNRTPVHRLEEVRPSSVSSTADAEVHQEQPQASLKSKLLGRTKDLLEAALHRSPKSSSTEQVTRTNGDPDSSLATGRLEQDELNNDGVTSVSSFTSLLIADSPLGEPTFIPPANISTSKQLRTLDPRKKGHNSTDPNKTPPRKNRLSRRGKSQMLDYDTQPLPNLSSDMLLTESPTTVRSPLNGPAIGSITAGSTSGSKRSKVRRGVNSADNDLGSFLAGTSLGPPPSLTTPQSALPSVL
ncbi:hypothetical protein FBUS_10053 [Fasciolopsis buskii]|uniref:DUF5743 domain-containing protein n=1 Tax=Fasciolopsis buskii TaxID=27845 RepID=A0A8E0VFU6_9TREM|nr:hypothetical protein FBUS_10053 [Fasciolopsis buski]